MIQAVIFDVDGVLLDSVPLHFHAWKKAFADENITITFMDYVHKINGLPRLNGVKNIMPNASENDQLRTAERKQTYLLSLARELPPQALPGVMSLLTVLKKRKLLLAAASSSKNARIFLENAGIADYFDHIITGNDFRFPKPHPDIFLTAASKLKIMADSCMVIEDAAVGLQAARNANMYAVGINTSQDAQIPLYANLVISSLAEYQEILHRFK